MPSPPAPAKHAPGRLERLNALRGPAALLVVLYHVRQIAVRDMGTAGLFEFWRFGHAGVDLFFVISGFVIYLVHRRDVGHPESTRRFLARRFIRVYPPLWIVTTCVLVAALVMTNAVRPEKMDLWFITRSYLLWPIQNALPLVPPAWTLSHEIKFYLLFALAIAFPKQVSRPLLVAALAGSAAVGVAEAMGVSSLPFALSFTLSPYDLEFAAGVIVMILVRARRVAAPRVIALLGTAAYVFAAMHDVPLPSPDVAQGLRYGIPSTLIVLGVAARDLREPVFDAPLLRLLGDASYAIYLVHLPAIIALIRVARATHVAPGVLALSVVAVLAVAFGVAFHLWVERPVTRWLTARFAARPVNEPVKESVSRERIGE